MIDASPAWGSHVTALAVALSCLAPGALVIEHGAGIYSSPLIARFDVRVLVVEEAPGWRSWSYWLYESARRESRSIDRAKLAIPSLAGAGLVFIDGAARERADLLRWSLEADVPYVIAHDTEAGCYGYPRHLLERGETVHVAGLPATTVWRR